MMRNIKFMLVIVSLIGTIVCGQSKKDDSNDVAALALLAQISSDQKLNSQVSQLFSALYPLPADANSNARALGDVDPLYNPFAAVITQACQLGGSQTIDGTLTGGATGNTGNDLLWSYDNCKENSIGVGPNGNAIPVPLTYNGTLKRSLNQRFNSSTSGNVFTSINSGTDRIQSSNYSINGITFPTFDITFTRNDSVYTRTEYQTGKFKGVLEEHVKVTGLFDGKAVDTTINYKIYFGGQ
ncbi:hypothetical protein LFX25_04595 [Leptospira sp. FAT2]|uniref:sigma factor SigX-regulated lipoprotein n=1 Tax=Leptospira sanjuanensis TaxID=2879643 RepID=UPI001EE7CEB9|nr:hypothetical protein [Leptospira sanjuanensis]MCG6167059.1 hypothetical protein [Leptospira sanjuanensis]MCG6192514.1 hypothetical protein [Leptospira sanjuanensis]